ncbi:nucleotidyltransferase domain-containing protein [Priestia aryabhattai]|uniref:nucleotidyltransferase domain-containing protein n=1 Tax=Priestia aryabhattai TaxID=412384 RepID=UPI00064E6C86|nr:nucleotidyltransferase family protein [Priestia aryabhattai]KML27258.1 Renal dipeptidase [Priestia aryabhattai]KMN98839.1 Renal dipeptidase [Priestia aryabhattai]
MDNILNLDRMPKELKLILELLKEGNEQYLEKYSEGLCRDIDWNLFIKLTLHHRVYPAINFKIKMLNADVVPTYVVQFLNRQYKRNTFQMLRLSAEMEKVSLLFSKHQIQTLFLKGPILAKCLYGDISLRTSSDLDFLIPIQDLAKAEDLLVSLGYEKDDYIHTVLNDWKWRHHHVTYIHPHTEIKLEIHWRLHPGPGKEPCFDELWKRKEKSSITSYPVYLLGTEDLFQFLVAHGARHGWSRLRWLIDIQQIVKRKIDWVKLYTLFTTYHNPYVGGQAIILASQLLNVRVEKKMKPLLISKRSQKLAQEAVFYLETMINLHTDSVPEYVSKYHSRHLFSLMSAQQKLFFTASLLHPYPEDAEMLPLPKKLHFLYFPLRPVLWAWRKTRKDELRKGRT